jgi:peptide/nickel transport system permease protein
MTEIALPDRHLGAVRTRRVSLVIVFCFLVVGVVIVMTLFGSLLAPHDPSRQDLSNVLARPSGAHWLGTDALGRDVFARIVAGARTAVIGPLVIAVGSALLGSLLGLLAGYRGGRTDSLLMRVVDLMWAVPGLLVIVVIAGVFGGGYWFAVALLVVLTTPFDIRMVRGATLEQVPRPYVEAARTLGVSDGRIMLFHIWPNVSSVVVVNVFLGFVGALIGLSGLSFLGLASAPGTPDWGLMISEARSLLFVSPVAALAPAAILVLFATCTNLIGDWLYERLSSRGTTR